MTRIPRRLIWMLLKVHITQGEKRVCANNDTLGNKILRLKDSILTKYAPSTYHVFCKYKS